MMGIKRKQFFANIIDFNQNYWEENCSDFTILMKYSFEIFK